MTKTIKISSEQAIKLANVLNEIYWSTEVEKTYTDSSLLLRDIISLVKSNINHTELIRLENPTYAHRIPSAQQLAELFLNKYNKILNQVSEYAYSINRRFGYTIDLVSVVCPYVLYLFGITDENLSFYIALGLAVSNIICDTLAVKKEASIEKEDTDEKIATINAMIILLENAQKYNNIQIESSLNELRKLLKRYQNKS